MEDKTGTLNYKRGQESQEQDWLNSSELKPANSKSALFLMRIFEVSFAFTALLFSLPVIAVLAILVRLDSPGPAFFRHQRITKGTRPFTFIKLRTHHVDSKERFPDLSAYEFSEEEVGDVHLQVSDDPRVTRFGCWLRQTSLDELPNFWHVLTGDMSLVGPRPEMMEMLPYYKGEMLEKFSVRPGITGLAQISGRGDLSFAETIEYDLSYVRNQSIKEDLRILWKTGRMILTCDGAM